MAVIARIVIDSAEHGDHDRLEGAVETRLQDLGGPPDGLMVHLGYPTDRGFVIVEAWRTEELFRWYREQVLDPALREAGLAAREPEIGPAWSIARP
jgi:hypothetical protein